jgi:hypothetical protein
MIRGAVQRWFRARESNMASRAPRSRVAKTAAFAASKNAATSKMPTKVTLDLPRPWGRSSVSFATWRETTHTLTINLTAQFSRRLAVRLRAEAAI